MRIKDDDKTWLHWYWLEFTDWIRVKGPKSEPTVLEIGAWLMVIVLLVEAGRMIYRCQL